MPFSKDVLIGSSGNQGAAAFYDHQIQHSMRFDRADNTYLSRTPSTESNRLKWSISFWHKCTQPNRLLAASNNYHQWWWCTSGENDSILLQYTADDHYYFQVGGQAEYPSAEFRDVGGWTHWLYVFDRDNGTQANKRRVYVNGVEHATELSQSQSNQSASNSTTVHYIGRRGDNNSAYHADGYIAQFLLVDNLVLTPSDVTDTKNGIVIPKDVSGLTYGTNGFLLEFGDASDLGNDTSGNNNDWSVSNAGTDHQSLDSPTFGE